MVFFYLTLSCLFYSEKAAKQVTPVTPHAEIRLGQESFKNLSLGKLNISS